MAAQSSSGSPSHHCHQLRAKSLFRATYPQVANERTGEIVLLSHTKKKRKAVFVFRLVKDELL